MIDKSKYLTLVQEVFNTGYLQKGAAIGALADAIASESDPIDQAVAAVIVFSELTKGIKKVTDLFFQCLGEINV